MVKAARVQRARTSALRAAIDRQAAAYHHAGSEREARGRRIRMAKRDVERALRFREQLLESVRTADAAAGDGIRRLLDEGITAVNAAVLVGLSRSQVKRLLRVTAAPAAPTSGRLSTADVTGGASSGGDVDRDTHGAARSATTEGVPPDPVSASAAGTTR